MTFAEQLKTHRERLGLTQAELAALLDVPARTHWEWESGKTTPHAITQEGALARLAKAGERCPQCKGSGWERIGEANLICCRECKGAGKQRIRRNENKEITD